MRRFSIEIKTEVCNIQESSVRDKPRTSAPGM
jgi:hypothetical protein